MDLSGTGSEETLRYDEALGLGGGKNWSEFNCSLSNVSSGRSEDSLIYMANPDEMLNPEKRNPFFFHIVITHSITFFIGILGNVVAISVMVGDRKSRNATILFLVSLAAADLLLLLLCVPLETLRYFVSQWDENGAVCKMAKYVELLSASASVLNLCAVSLERFIVIVFPMRSRSLCTLSNCRKAIILVWVVALLLSTPVILATDIMSAIYCNNVTFVIVHYCVEEGLPIVIYEFIILFAAPGLLMMICYTYVIRELWRSTQNISLLTNAKSIRNSGRLSTLDKGISENISGGNAAGGSKTFSSRCLRNGRDHPPMKILPGTASSVGTVRQRTVHHNRQNKGEDAKKARKQVIKMLILVIVLFLVSWGPKLIFAMIIKLAYAMGISIYTQKIYVGRVVFGLIPFIHSCINPIIYSFMSKNFRRSMQRQVNRCCVFFGCKCFKCGSSRNSIPLRSTTRTRTLQGVDSMYSSNYCPLSEGIPGNT
ncbi:unnamed protein product [Allacma fusca]|uniref:G-protein coupled receptors family 1 profile domain-containing protein n=1 Tax=Allacma fusca TaxID=39272 RepID=A0A8J2P0U9_9HEXA|nr:unnamed protein product [Allacma fusca]